MESNFKTQNICTKECLLKCEKDIHIETEFVLPDYCPPIKKVLSVKTEPAISSKNISGSVLNLDGVSGLKVIYLDDRDTLCSYENAFIFSKNIECDFDLQGVQISADATSDRLNLRVLSERKLELKGPIVVKICINRANVHTCLCPMSSDGYETLCTTLPSKDRIMFTEKSLILDEEVSLSESHAQIGKILNYSGKILADECKVMNGKVMLKGNLLVCVTYLSAENFTACHYEQKLPYSQVCDVDGIDENFNCKTEEKLVFLEVKCRNSGYDETRTMTVNAKMNICVEVYCESDSTVVLDIYSTNKSIEPLTEAVRIRSPKEQVNDTFIAKKTLEFSGGAVSSVLDIRSDVQTTGIKQIDNCISVFGIAYIKMIVCDANGTPEFSERAIDFEYKYKTAEDAENKEYDALIHITNMSYVISSDSCIEISCEMAVCLEIFEVTEYNVVTSVTDNGEAPKSTNECSIIVCYLENDTDIWSIAKKYKSSVADIAALNSVDSGKNTVSGAVIVPVK